jgi:hypothetical protein
MMTNFIPNLDATLEKEVVFFEDAKVEDGWGGYRTRKTIETLKQEVREALRRLGGQIDSFQQGRFPIGEHTRDGYRIRFSVERFDGVYLPGQLDVVALPVRAKSRKTIGVSTKQKQSLKMALFMLRDALKGQWFFKKLSNDYAPLLPFMLGPGEKTMSHMWLVANDTPLLAAVATEGEFVEAEIVNDG